MAMQLQIVGKNKTPFVVRNLPAFRPCPCPIPRLSLGAFTDGAVRVLTHSHCHCPEAG